MRLVRGTIKISCERWGELTAIAGLTLAFDRFEKRVTNENDVKFQVSLFYHYGEVRIKKKP
jgi:acetamidase/formamidase